MRRYKTQVPLQHFTSKLIFDANLVFDRILDILSGRRHKKSGIPDQESGHVILTLRHKRYILFGTPKKLFMAAVSLKIEVQYHNDLYFGVMISWKHDNDYSEMLLLFVHSSVYLVAHTNTTFSVGCCCKVEMLRFLSHFKFWYGLHLLQGAGTLGLD